jgi:hypothetical protein
VADVALRHEAIPERREPCLGEPGEICLAIGVVPEHLGPEVVLDPGPALKADDREQVAARTQPTTDLREERPLILLGMWMNA